MDKKEFSLARRKSPELKRPFPLIQDLFAFAKKNKIEFRQDEVTVELPEEFQPLVADLPNKYFIVAYEDRRDSYYKEDTRGQIITLSTVKSRAETDELTNEFQISQMNKARADRVEVKVRQAVMDKSFERINEAEGEELEQSHGSAWYTYELDEHGQKYPQKMEFNRLDEGLFKMGEVARPVRWLRTLDIEKQKNQPDNIGYMDYYMIRDDENPAMFTRTQIKSKIVGNLDKPQSVFIEVGSGPEESAEVLVNDQVHALKFIIHKDWSDKDPLKIIKDDPVYAPLFNKEVNVDLFVEGLQSRMQSLKEDWHKPQSVYETVPAFEQKQPALEEGK